MELGLELLHCNNEGYLEHLLKQRLEIRQKIRRCNNVRQYHLYLQNKIERYPNQH